MSATIISNVPPFGASTNRTIANLHTVDEAISRLAAAVATASSAFQGTPGTEFEGEGNNFGVVASDVPGEQGLAYAFAVNTLATGWRAFWSTASPSIQQLDNGTTLP
jgi:hypothetical protein